MSSNLASCASECLGISKLALDEVYQKCDTDLSCYETVLSGPKYGIPASKLQQCYMKCRLTAESAEYPMATSYIETTKLADRGLKLLKNVSDAGLSSVEDHIAALSRNI